MNMKRMFSRDVKRAFAFALTVCMLFSILPAGVIEAPSGIRAKAAVGDVITYNFLNRTAATDNFIVNGEVNPKFTNFDHVAEGEGKWKYFYHDASKTKDNQFFQSSGYGIYMRTSNVDAKYQFLIYFDGEGYYSVDANIGYWSSCADARLSLIPCDENGANQKAEIELGEISGNADDPSGTWNVPTQVGQAFLEKGYYILNIVCGYRNSTVNRTIIGSLSFTELDESDVNIEPPIPSVEADVFKYNFLNRQSGDAYFIVDGAVNPKFTTFDHVAEGEGKWKYFNHDADKTQIASGRQQFFQSSAYGLYIRTTGNDAKYQFLIYFDGDGYFSVDADIGYWSWCLAAGMSLIPCDENGANQKAPIELGKIDGAAESGGTWNVPTHVGKVSLEKGYYILNISCNRKSSNVSRAIIGSLSFTEINLDVSTEPPAPVAIGESVVSKINIADAADLDTPVECTAVYAKSKLAKFALDEEGNLKVTAGDTAGEEVVEVIFEANGKTQAVKMPIIVYAPEDLNAKTYEYNFTKANEGVFLEDAMTSYNQTSAGATGELRAAVMSSPWKFESSEVGFEYKDNYIHNSAYSILVYNEQGKAKVRFYLPSSGNYKLFTVNRVSTDAAPAKVSFSLQRADGTGKYAENTLVGSVTPTGSEAAYNTKELRIGNEFYYLEAGEYILTYDIDASGGRYFLPLGFKLQGFGKSAVSYDDIEPVAIKRNTTIQYPVKIPSGSTVKDTKISITNNIADIASVVENGELKLQITGKENGSATVTYEANMADGSYCEGYFDLFVNFAGVIVAKDLRFDYHKLNRYLHSGNADDLYNGVDVRSVTDLSMTTIGSAEEINPKSTVDTQPWCYVSDTGEQLRYDRADYGMFLDYEPASMVFKIRVANDGLYRPISEHLAFDSGAMVKIWLAPEGVSDTTADEYYLGGFDTYSETMQKKIQQELKIVNLSAGDYILTYKMEGMNEAVRSKGRFGVNAFILKGMDTATVINASVSGPDKIPVGGEGEFILNAVEDIGSAEVPVSVDVSVSMSNDIAEATVEQNADKTQTKIKLVGTGIGNTIVSVIVTSGNIEETVTFPLTVYENDTVAASGTEYKYFFCGTMLDGMNISEIDSFSKMMAGSPDEVRPNNGITSPWKFEFQNVAAFFIPPGAQDSYGGCMSSGIGSSAGIRIRLPESGIYTPVVPLYSGNQCGIFRTYIAPADAENPMDEKYSVGTWDAYAPGYTYIDAIFRSLYLKAGDYIVSWKIIGEHKDILEPGKGRMWYKGITLKAISDYPDMTVTADTNIPSVKLGNSVQIKLDADVADGVCEDFFGAEFIVDDESASKVKADTVIGSDGTAYLELTGIDKGSCNAGISLVLNGIKRTQFTVPVTVINPGILDSIKLSLEENDDNTIIRRGIGESFGNIAVDMRDTDGDAVSLFSAKLQNATFTYASENPSIAKVDENGVITPISDGTVKINCAVSINGITKSDSITIKVVPGKARKSYYTEGKLSAARENADSYLWARNQRNAAVDTADKYLDNEELLWDMVTTNELPRSYHVGYSNDPTHVYCRYPGCGVDIAAEYGRYPWKFDAFNAPWKVQCPACRRRFPSNDFGSFYQLGIKPDGKWSYELAKQKNRELVEMGHSGYLVNVLYPEMGEGWGVDDGYGYDTGNITSTGVKEVHTYISYYNHWAIWNTHNMSVKGTIYSALDALKNAYVYTGDAKYGRVGAILLDRIADVYPEQDTRPFRWQLTADASYAPHGKSLDMIWENANAYQYALCYDAFYNMYSDEAVISFLSEKAKSYNMENTKSNANLIRENIEDGILREVFNAACGGSLNGNFGMTQSAVAAAAVVLDTMPETREWLDWIFRDGTQTILYPESKQADVVTGGNVMRQIIDLVDRDGLSNEIAPNYVSIWATGLKDIMDILEGYDGYEAANLYKNARVVKMISALNPLIMSRRETAAIGDSGRVALANIIVSDTLMQSAWKNTGKPEFAQMMYFLNGNSSEKLHYDIFTKNPEQLANEVEDAVKTHGEYDFDKSEMLTGYGIAILRDGTEKESVTGNVDTQSTYWMSFIRNANRNWHGHRDKLNLGVEAYGANIAPELGYAHATVGDIYYYWDRSTIAHNTVVVDDLPQNVEKTVGRPLHFDDSGMVKVMDVEENNVYANTDKYRRSVVTVNVDEETSYAVDFFRVKGGTEHVYSFHALSTETPTVGVNGGDAIKLNPQINETTGKYIGTYAGKGVEYATENISSGYSYLRNVDRAANPGNEVCVDFKIDDNRKQMDKERQVYLKLTMLNSFDLSELAIAEGEPAQVSGNPKYLKYMLARRSSLDGLSLDSLFTTVIEPYDKKSKIASMEQVKVVKATDGGPADPAAVKAVKVTLNSGRADYIVYAEDNSVEYVVDDKFAFKGFVGVYSEMNGKNVYSYINDGTKIGALTGDDKLNGTVTGFTKDLTDKNSITVSFNDTNVDVASLAGKYIYIDSYAKGNGTYEIVSATANENGTVELDIGDVTLIDTLKDAENGVYTYNYNILDDGTATFSIPLAASVDNRPIITPVPDLTVAVGSKFTKQISAVSPIGNNVSIEPQVLPRGAVFDRETNRLIWVPDNTQIGTHTAVLRATDEDALSSAIYITIDVLRSVGSSGGSVGESTGDGAHGGNSGAGNVSDGGAGGGGSSGGNGGSADKPDSGEQGGDTAEDEQFTDLGNHSWAKEAIYALVEKGVVKGTSGNTYSPANNIKRADFAIMLTRAFGITEGDSEQFADVDTSKYYAEELRLAKSAGIVAGVGENKFNPEGEISRQDMMLMLYRALKAQGYELGEPDHAVLADFSDAALISDYAKDAVAVLVADGIIAGSNGQIRPKAQATRAEIAVMLLRVIAEK